MRLDMDVATSKAELLAMSRGRAQAYLEEGLSQGFEGGFPFFSVLLLRQDAQGSALGCRRRKGTRELFPCRPRDLAQSFVGFLESEE